MTKTNSMAPGDRPQAPPARRPQRRPARRAGGFTLLELLVVAGLMTGLTLLVSGLWRHYARSFGDLATRAQLVQELRLATCSLAEDMGPAVGATVMGEGRLMICRDGGDAPNGQPDWAAPDQMVEYYLSQGRLIRHDCTGGAELTVAQDVSSFSLHDAGSSLQMVLCMGKGGLSRQVTLLWSRPT